MFTQTSWWRWGARKSPRNTAGSRTGRARNDMTTLQPPVAAEPRPAPPPAKRDRRSWTGWGFIGPFVVVFALVFLAPIGYSIYLSLFRDKLIGGNQFVGL